ncbi:hypothetical protein SAMN05877753_103176 [Bacillus oleivorans]|uniref:DUF3951 domain-containing protein n=1 Tax=Bacillus oleivorans TaxID=1448271 RepID=A0A285CQ76_9BACI|nr:hypothetical protein [Bacillus oleivorans]SNX69681.1 hypothetical protein SAMN05877753_103176 [Bacillus oleivorans]
MQYFVFVLIIGVIAYSLIKMFKRKNNKLPSNQYTPLDDIDNGVTKDYSNEPLKVETRYEERYEEVDKSLFLTNGAGLFKNNPHKYQHS